MVGSGLAAGPVYHCAYQQARCARRLGIARSLGAEVQMETGHHSGQHLARAKRHKITHFRPHLEPLQQLGSRLNSEVEAFKKTVGAELGLVISSREGGDFAQWLSMRGFKVPCLWGISAISVVCCQIPLDYLCLLKLTAFLKDYEDQVPPYLDR